MRRAIEVLTEVAQMTDRVILFHSLSGKDSIALLDLCYPMFKKIVCVYMYVTKDLDHTNVYLNYATKKYPSVEFIQVPHFAVFSYIRGGYLGCRQDESQKQFTLAQLTDIVREKTGIEWVGYGMKKTDGLNRRLMLQGYRMQGISDKTKKFYPLATYKNSDVLDYIEDKNLKKPERYGKGQSSGTNVGDIDYLLYLREKFPNDLEKVKSQYPLVERILYEYDYENKEL